MYFLRTLPSLLALIACLVTCFIAPLLATSALAHDPDPTRLPIGNGKVSTMPQRGHVMNCPSPMLGGRAQVQGPWIRADGTFDFNAYDRNPNAIRQQEFRLELPVLPVVADTPC